MLSTATPHGRPVRVDRLDPDQVRAVLALAGAASDTDGVEPLPEQVLIRLGEASGTVHLLVGRPTGGLLGYAHLDLGKAAHPGARARTDGPTAALVVHPAHRRRGLGRALASAALTVADAAGSSGGAGAGPLSAWAHGDHPSAAALAFDLGFTPARVLLRLHRQLRTPLPEPALPAGVRLRTFRPGDDEAWVALNARAFAGHPEQGRWRVPELRVRMAQPWFDPAGFFLAEEATTGRLLGYHWTKVHTEAAVGEVYVLGVDPAAHGGGLGRALALAGLRHLREDGLDRAMLYVDEVNQAAMALYTRLGFVRRSADVNYRRI